MRRLCFRAALLALGLLCICPPLGNAQLLDPFHSRTYFTCSISAEGTLGSGGTQCDLTNAGLPAGVQVLAISMIAQTGGDDLRIRRGDIAHATVAGVSNYTVIPAGGGYDEGRQFFSGAGLAAWRVAPAAAGSVVVTGWVTYRR